MGSIRKYPKIHPRYHFRDFSILNDNLGLKMKIWKFLGIQPRNKSQSHISEESNSESSLLNSELTNFYDEPRFGLRTVFQGLCKLINEELSSWP